jgi:outer membrane receptor protein involved in Fe transport
VRTSPLVGWNTGLSLWTTHLASELVFVGDDGVTEPEGGSRRYGVEWWNDATIGRWINVDADVAISHARFEQASNGGRHVPNAIPLSASMGISADAKGPWLAGVRLRYIGAYPLEETGTQKSSPAFTTNVKLGYRIDPRWQLSADILNLFDTKAYDIAYWGTSCTRSEGVACNSGNGIDGRLVHPMEPRTIRVSIRASL